MPDKLSFTIIYNSFELFNVDKTSVITACDYFKEDIMYLSLNEFLEKTFDEVQNEYISKYKFDLGTIFDNSDDFSKWFDMIVYTEYISYLELLEGKL